MGMSDVIDQITEERVAALELAAVAFEMYVTAKGLHELAAAHYPDSHHVRSFPDVERAYRAASERYHKAVS